MRRIFFSVVLMLGFSFSGNTQNVEEPTTPGLAILSRPLEDSIMLRWGPTTPMAWELSNEYGYKIERVTILRNHKLLDKPEEKLLTPSPIRPWPMAQWESLVDKNDYAAIAGQALFGETFQVTENMSSDMMQVVNKARELEMRFSFALFAADQSQEVAKASGLYFVDNNVNEGEKYLYRIYTLVPEQTLPIDTGYVYTGTMDYAPLPSPIEMNAAVEDRYVELRWNSENYQDIYSSYMLERAEDGGAFRKINEKPIVNTYKGDRPKSRFTFRMDSLPRYNTEYQYRVRGISPFGEVGPPSDTAKVMAYEKNKINPYIVEKINVDNESIKLVWEFDQKDEAKIRGFSVMRAPNPKAVYDTIASGLSPTTRSFVDESPELANYYVVAAEDHGGKFRNSFPALAQLVDSIPPAAPTGLVGVIDTTGLVTLTWKPNKESDLWGYRIYRANYSDEEYSQLTVSPVTENVFYDTIPLRNLTPQIYYKVMAVDRRDNPSVFSTPAKLIKPDLLPPVAPVIENVESTDEGVKLTIIPSSSADVNTHLLYRKNINETNWQLVSQFDSLKSKLNYTDSSQVDYKKYKYTIVAVDHSGLESEQSNLVEGKKIDNGVRDRIRNIYAEANREERFIHVEWKYDKIGIDKFLIYKSDGDQGYRLYKTIKGDNKFVDRSLKINSIYKYKVMAVYKSGARSPLSKEVSVNY